MKARALISKNRRIFQIITSSILILFPLSSYGQLYVGGGLGSSSLDIDLLGTANSSQALIPIAADGALGLIPSPAFDIAGDGPLPSGIFSGPALLAGSNTTAINLIEDKHDTSLKLFAGYQLTQSLGFEAAYQNLGKVNPAVQLKHIFTSTDPLIPNINSARVQNLNIETIGLSFFGIMQHPIGEKFSLVTKAGAFFWKEEMTSIVLTTINNSSSAFPQESLNNHGTSLALGLGIEYQLSERLSLQPEYEYFHNVNQRNINVFNINLKANF